MTLAWTFLHSLSETTIGPATSSLFSLPQSFSTMVSANKIAVPGPRLRVVKWSVREAISKAQTSREACSRQSHSRGDQIVGHNDAIFRIAVVCVQARRDKRQWVHSSVLSRSLHAILTFGQLVLYARVTCYGAVRGDATRLDCESTSADSSDDLAVCKVALD